jgi:NAD(P)H-hydrate epimerase
LGVTSEIIENDRLRAIRKAQKMMNCVVLLKGHHSLVASSKKTYQNKSGNSALAKAGTGDVLAGMITSLRAQGLGPIQATLLGTYLHGACANLWVARGKDHLSMMASDIIEILPELIFKLRQSI